MQTSLNITHISKSPAVHLFLHCYTVLIRPSDFVCNKVFLNISVFAQFHNQVEYVYVFNFLNSRSNVFTGSIAGGTLYSGVRSVEAEIGQRA